MKVIDKTDGWSILSPLRLLDGIAMLMISKEDTSALLEVFVEERKRSHHWLHIIDHAIRKAVRIDPVYRGRKCD